MKNFLKKLFLSLLFITTTLPTDALIVRLVITKNTETGQLYYFFSDAHGGGTSEERLKQLKAIKENLEAQNPNVKIAILMEEADPEINEADRKKSREFQTAFDEIFKQTDLVAEKLSKIVEKRVREELNKANTINAWVDVKEIEQSIKNTFNFNHKEANSLNFICHENAILVNIFDYIPKNKNLELCKHDYSHSKFIGEGSPLGTSSVLSLLASYKAYGFKNVDELFESIIEKNHLKTCLRDFYLNILETLLKMVRNLKKHEFEEKIRFIRYFCKIVSPIIEEISNLRKKFAKNGILEMPNEEFALYAAASNPQELIDKYVPLIKLQKLIYKRETNFLFTSKNSPSWAEFLPIVERSKYVVDKLKKRWPKNVNLKEIEESSRLNLKLIEKHLLHILDLEMIYQALKMKDKNKILFFAGGIHMDSLKGFFENLNHFEIIYDSKVYNRSGSCSNSIEEFLNKIIIDDLGKVQQTAPINLEDFNLLQDKNLENLLYHKKPTFINGLIRNEETKDVLSEEKNIGSRVIEESGKDKLKSFNLYKEELKTINKQLKEEIEQISLLGKKLNIQL